MILIVHLLVIIKKCVYSFIYIFIDVCSLMMIAREFKHVTVNPSAWGHLNPSSYYDVGRLFYGVFKLWSKLQRKK